MITNAHLSEISDIHHLKKSFVQLMSICMNIYDTFFQN